MNVFVLSTGRSATTTLCKACEQITNYSCAHESRVGVLSAEKLQYADNHIEIDNRLIWFSHRLDSLYKSHTFYAHLRRDREKVAKSYCERWNLKESIVKAYGHGVLMMPKIEKTKRMAVCLDFVNYVEQKIEVFLSNKPNSVVINVENIQNDFEHFWELIGAQGDFEAAISTFNNLHNRNNTSWLNKLKNLSRK
jgi:hypothetical protein